MVDSSMPVLGYWKIRGLSQQIKYQLEYCGVDYKEELYEQGDGPEFSRQTWLDVKPTLGLDFPNLPYWIDGDVKLTETVAIHKYIAAKYRPDLLLLNDPAGYATSEMAMNIVRDLKMKVTGPCYMNTIPLEEFVASIPDMFEALNKFFDGRKWCAGDRLSIPDFELVEMLELCDYLTKGKIFEESKN